MKPTRKQRWSEHWNELKDKMYQEQWNEIFGRMRAVIRRAI